MKINTRMFGEIEIDEEKIINFDLGIIGFDFLKKFTLIHDEDEEDNSVIWLQSLDEPAFAMPVMNPLLAMDNYNPSVEDELFKNIGETDGDIIVFVTLTVPDKIENMTVNLRAPIIINPKTRKGCQIIVEETEYLVKYPVYEALKANKQKGGE
ncbi:MAG: flagellar assembly protein FliW [Lachnospiraceae bacterium]|nr:flagellar assembly protein FliW [Lachnospiraceae bacterium]MCR5082257.1 flagellar assembly protein FliW [Parasporobacterium sp.]